MTEREIILEAVTLIRGWHGMGMPKEEEQKIWDIYYNKAPEMKIIREYLSRPVEKLVSQPSELKGKKVIWLRSIDEFNAIIKQERLAEREYLLKIIKDDIPYWDLNNDDINECLKSLEELLSRK